MRHNKKETIYYKNYIGEDRKGNRKVAVAMSHSNEDDQILMTEIRHIEWIDTEWQEVEL